MAFTSIAVGRDLINKYGLLCKTILLTSRASSCSQSVGDTLIAKSPYEGPVWTETVTVSAEVLLSVERFDKDLGFRFEIDEEFNDGSSHNKYG